jgi:hypothetical protein
VIFSFYCDCYQSYLDDLTILRNVIANQWLRLTVAVFSLLVRFFSPGCSWDVLRKIVRVMCVVVGLFVRILCVWVGCACVGWVCMYVYEQILQLYPDERCQKKKKNCTCDGIWKCLKWGISNVVSPLRSGRGPLRASAALGPTDYGPSLPANKRRLDISRRLEELLIPTRTRPKPYLAWPCGS